MPLSSYWGTADERERERATFILINKLRLLSTNARSMEIILPVAVLEDLGIVGQQINRARAREKKLSRAN